MLPLSNSTTDHNVKRTKTPQNILLSPMSVSSQELWKPSSFTLSSLHYPRLCLFFLILLLVQVFILFYSNHRPPFLSTASPPLTISTAPTITFGIGPETATSTFVTVPATTTTIAAVPATTTTIATVPETTTNIPTVPATTTFASVPATTTTIATVPETTITTIAKVPATTTIATVPENNTIATVPATTNTIATVPATTTPGCKNGKFYIYDLPPVFNSDIYTNCDSLNPQHSQCLTLSNDGFGPKALGIDRVIPRNLSDAWYATDQFSSEIIFHNRLKHHKCRTLDPNAASAYYIPFYAGLAVGKYLWYNYTFKDRDRHCDMMLQWLNSNSIYFNRSQGWDHFLVMGRITWDFRRTEDKNWGSKFMYMPLMKNISRLVIERDPWDYFDIGIPYPTSFHPRTPFDVKLWQDFVRTRERKSLFCFAGGLQRKAATDFRSILLNQCLNSNGSCRVMDCARAQCANGKPELLETFLDSEFCLQPRGDSLTRRSIFDCLVAGSIPVFSWRRSAYMQYEWFLPSEPKSYSVFIHRDEIGNGTLVKDVLEKFSKEEVKEMRDKIVEFIPRLIYAKPNEGLGSIKDAVDIAVDAVLKRIKEKKEGDFIGK